MRIAFGVVTGPDPLDGEGWRSLIVAVLWGCFLAAVYLLFGRSHRAVAALRFLGGAALWALFVFVH
jgi:hypothetical protein